MSSTGRVAFIACDAMDVDIVRDMVARGKAPTFASLWQTAAFAATENPRGFIVGSTWPSLWSGVWPSRHGWYSFRQLVNGTYETRLTSPAEIEYEPFWISIARAGRRVRVYDVPLAMLSPHANCVHVVEWGGHDRIYGAQSSPPAELDALTADVGAYALNGECDEYADRSAFRELHEGLRQGIIQRTKVTRHAIEQSEWDLLVSVFAESHCAGHNLWREPDLLEDVYAAVDRGLGEILDALPTDATAVILLSHGVAPAYGAEHLHAEIVRRLDDSYGAPSRLLTVRERVARPIGRWMHQRRYRRSGASSVPGALQSVDSSRRFFAVPGIGISSYVRFNLEGREPRGRVRPGADADRLADSLRRDFLDLVDQDTGEPVVRDVWRTADAYDGPIDDLPDLVIDWDPNAPCSTIASPRIGVLHKPRGGIRAGEHRAPGMLFVRGCDISPGPVGADVQSVDIGPTLMAMLGVNADDLDGRVVASLVPRD